MQVVKSMLNITEAQRIWQLGEYVVIACYHDNLTLYNIYVYTNVYVRVCMHIARPMQRCKVREIKERPCSSSAVIEVPLAAHKQR